MNKLYIFLMIFFLTSSFAEAQNGVVFHAFPANYTLQQLRTRSSIKIDNLQNVWLSFLSIGLGKYDGSTWTFFDTTNSPLPSNTVYDIDFDNFGNQWIAAKGALIKFDGVNWTSYDSINSGLPGEVVKLKCSGNNVLCGTQKGLAVFDGNVWNVFNTQNSSIAGDTVSCLETGLNGEYWIGIKNAGVSKLYNSSWTVYDSSNTDLTSNYIKEIVVDSSNHAWFYISGSNLFRQNGLQVENFSTVYSGVVPIDKPFQSVTRNNAGNLTIVNAVFSGISINEIVFPSAKIRVVDPAFVIAPGGQINSDYLYDTNGILWLSYIIVNNMQYGIESFDASQSTPLPFSFTNENSKFLDINHAKAAMLNRGDMHWDLAQSAYEVPKSSGKNAVFASDLWIGGIDNTGQLRMAAQNYRQTGHDYWPGPIDTVSHLADTATASLYDKIWKVNRVTILDFVTNYANGNVTSGAYTVPPEILSWPAHGTGNISRELAPFIDFNNDGVYNPYDGDYPDIKGDQMLFWIINDVLGPHTVTGSPALGVELHCSAYAFSCDVLPDSLLVMDRSTFYHFRIINRSAITLDSVMIGLFSDMDIGNVTDDVIGCDSILNAGFTYNGDNDDDGAQGYGLNPPIESIKILDGPLADVGDGIDNDHDGTIDESGEKFLMSTFMTWENTNNTPNGNPNNGIDFYRYLNATWLDGIPLTIGGNGYNQGSMDVTKFSYSGTPYDSTGWNGSVGITPGVSDQRLLLGCGPFTLPAGAETSIDFSYVFSWENTVPNGINTSIVRLRNDLQKVQNWYDANNFPSCLVLNPGIQEEHSNSLDFKIYPVPVSDFINVTGNDFKAGFQFEIFDITGRKINEGRSLQKIVVKNIVPGIYYLRVHENSKTASHAFIKQ